MRGFRITGLLLGFVVLMSLMMPMTLKAQGTATADQYFAAGQQYFTAKNYAQAAQYYNAAVKMNPNYAQAYQGLGNCYYSLGRKADALPFYQKASALQPNNAQLAQFVQSLQAQVGAGGAAAPGGMGMTAADPLSQGSSLFQQKQYAASIPYFQQAAQSNPNDYRPFYYAGYAYYMTGNAKYAALYFAVANVKQPNASIQAYAQKVKATLPPDDQQWVDDQVAKYTGTAMAGGSGKNDVDFGFHILGGTTYILANPTQIINGVKAAQVTDGGFALTGTTPNMVALAGLEPYIQLGQNFEINLGAEYIPVGTLSYTITDITNNIGAAYSYDTNIVAASLGMKVLFGDSKVKGYFGLGVDIAPVSTTLSVVETDGTGTPNGQTFSQNPSGSYSTIAFGGYAKLGVDFYLGKGIAVGPFIGFQLLSATNFQNGGSTLLVDQTNGGVTTTANSNTTPLTMDFSNINGGLDLTFSF